MKNDAGFGINIDVSTGEDQIIFIRKIFRLSA